MLATPLQSQLRTGELGGALPRKTVVALGEGELATVCHMVNMRAHHARLNDNMPAVYSSKTVRWTPCAKRSLCDFL